MKNETAFSVGKRDMYFILGLVILISGLAGYNEYRSAKLKESIQQVALLQTKLFEAFASSTESTIEDVNARINNLTNESVALSGAIQSTQNRNEVVAEQIGRVSGTVGSLDKLSKTDPQLLQKYSKVYFLNEHYTPSALETVPAEFSYNKNTKYQVHAKMYPYLNSMLNDAKTTGLSLQVISAFRSYGTQAALKSSYKVTYGAGTANQFSADQGYSEHQLGTTLDFTTPTVGASYEGFDATPEFAWLTANAYKYGFVLSYPKNNKYYMYEPWHWRYVGKDLALKLHTEGKYFYDLEQRVIDNYLLLIFE
ncbi:MAG TPA: M15 family metallopeptidase [Candidatus Paceibacterota bacterium]